jgi:hypothetical protein
MARGTLDALAVPAARALAVVGDFLQADDGEELLANLGYKIPDGSDLASLFTDVGDAANDLSSGLSAVLAAYDDGSWEEPSFLPKVAALAQAVANFAQAANGLTQRAQMVFAAVPDFLNNAPLDELPRRLLDYLLARYLQRDHPRLAGMLELLGVLGQTFMPEGDHNPDFYLVEIHWERVPRWLSDPRSVIVEEYAWGSAAFDDPLLLERLAGLLWMFGITGSVVDESETADPTDPPPHQLELPLYSATIDVPPEGLTGIEVGARLRRAEDQVDADNAGLDLVPYLDGSATTELELREGWGLILMGALASEGLMISVHPKTGTQVSATGAIGGAVGVTLARHGDVLGPVVLFGNADGTRLEIADMSLDFAATLHADGTADAGLELRLSQMALIVLPGDSDGFLQEILREEGLRADFDLAPGWSQGKGLYLGGSAGLEATLSVHSSLLGAITLDSVYVALRARDTGIQAVVATTASVKLGPVTANIERVGLLANFSFPPDGGNLGPANLELDFKPPNGAGLVIDSGVVVGGGYLFFDPENEQYAGVLQLEFAEKISLTAIGLLTTRLPDGSRGFSLLVIVSSEGFSPIPLGFGFTLNGVGGLLGVNRTAMADTLRAGIKNGTLGSILFPNDPIRNAPQIISDLRTVFPPAPERYLFGPMAMLGWGSPTILTLEIGLLLELPEPIRLILLGRLKIALPDEERALVQVRMDAIGVVDFQRGEISLDATLYDSRILQFALTGDMAMRVSLGERPNFVLSIGGFNPRFAAPPGLPRLSRLALSLATGDNPRLRFEAYLALTSNTVQFGARLELLVRAGPFSLEGLLGFDAMFQFDPFRFIADLAAGVALRYEGSVLMAVYLDATLAGPTPWHARGMASFQILFFKVAISFEARIGHEEPPAPLEAADVLGLLSAACADARNWSGELPPGVRPLVSVRPASDGTAALRAHPLAQLTVRQRVAPLNRRIEKFGNRRLEAGARAYAVAAVRADGGAPVSATPVTDVFALGQYQEMSDDEKLSRPSFEAFDSGLRFGSEDFTYHHDPATDATVEYETRIVDTDSEGDVIHRDGEPHLMSAVVFDAVVDLGAAGQAEMHRTGASRYRDREPGAVP